MAKKYGKNENVFNYSAALRKLREQGPERLYILHGKEDYLREQFLSKLKEICLPDGEDSFSSKRIDGPELDEHELRAAVDAMPFLTDRCFVELRNIDINKLKSAENYISIFSDIPDYCTVAIVLSAEYEPDGRLKLIKSLKELGEDINFSVQSQGLLIDWVIRRFAAAGKSVELEAAQRLLFISGEYMSRLIPEIDKIAAYTKGDRVRVYDVETVANHIPEARIFDMTDYISQKKYNNAAAEMAELLSDKNNEPIMLIAVLGTQMRKLYVAKLAELSDLGTKYIMDVCAMKSEYPAKKLISAARGFSMDELKKAVELCAEADYKMKSSGGDQRQLLLETMMRICAGEKSVQH